VSAGRKHAGGSGPAEQSENKKRDQNRRQRRNIQGQKCTNRNQQKKPRQGKKQVGESSGEAQPDSTEVSCEAADQRGQYGRDQSGGGSKQKRDAGSVKHARKAIAAHFIGSEPMLMRGRRTGGLAKLFGVSGGRQPICG